ncbi:MAG: beta-eliminating lyase-related protein [Planctomycetota bacterium]
MSPPNQERIALARACRKLVGHGNRNPADEFERVAAWCRAQGLNHDEYGDGEFLQSFEARVAELLGFEAARFMPSGTMGQQIALRIWADRAESDHVGFHPTSHLELHEQAGYAELHNLRSTLIGPTERPILAADLREVTDPLAALLIELPTRENGGQLPTWEELRELTGLARSQNTRLHLDGARLWEAQVFYDRPFPEICGEFDSAYVSFYKGIGALPGSMLLGAKDFIEEAAIWQRRQGGNLASSLVAAASAAMRLEPQLVRMSAYRERAMELAPLIAAVEGIELIPNPPQVNMFHLHFNATPDAIASARDQVARETGLWIVGGARAGEQPDTSRTEVTIGESALELDIAELATAFARMMGLARQS